MCRVVISLSSMVVMFRSRGHTHTHHCHWTIAKVLSNQVGNTTIVSVYLPDFSSLIFYNLLSANVESSNGQHEADCSIKERPKPHANRTRQARRRHSDSLRALR